MNIAARRYCELWRRATRCYTVGGAIWWHPRRLTGPLLDSQVARIWSAPEHSIMSRALLPERNAIWLCSRNFGDYPPHKVITLPNLSPTMETGSVLSWGRKEGESVMEGDLLAEIETDKATMSMDASDSGVLAKILVPAGTKDIPIGTPLCVIVENEANVAAFATFSVQPGSTSTSTAAAQVASAPPTTQQPQPIGGAVGVPASPMPSLSQIPLTTAAPGMQSQSGRLFVSPLARTLAAQRGLDLASLAGKGSGPGGRIRAVDLDQSTSLQAVSSIGATHAASFTDIELSAMRKVIAQRLSLSKQTIPHYSLSVDVRLDRVLEMRATINRKLTRFENSAGKSQKLSINDFVIKAAAMACLRVPECNSSWHDTFIRQYEQVDVNVAVATERGLITPIVFGAHSKGLAQINSDVAALAAKAKQNKLQPHEFQGGTFTVSNLGMFGIACFNAIINPPQACILAVGGSQERLELASDGADGSKPAAGGDIRKTTYMSVTLSCDHRVVDGAVGARWLREFKENLEDPVNMLM